MDLFMTELDFEEFNFDWGIDKTYPSLDVMTPPVR